MTITRTLQERDPGFETKMAARCADQDPVGAANFYAQPFAAGSASDLANLRTVLKRWIAKDRHAAEIWAKGQEGTPHFEVVSQELQSPAQAN